MKQLATLAFVVATAAPAFAQTSVGVSVGINQPGVYGRIDIGNYPPPAVVYQQPVIITPAPIAVQRQPIYLYVPPGHQKNWGRYCGHYNACNQPVYFVEERWVQDRWEHEHRGYEHDQRGQGHGNKGKGKGHGH